MARKKAKKIQKTKVAALCIAALALLAAVIFLLGGENKTQNPNEVEMTTYGIDVARYQGTIDWQEVAASGVDFAMVRLGYRGLTDGVIAEDPNARYNLQEAPKYGIRLGAYFFSTAITAEEAKEEAAWIAEILSRYPITYPVAYNCEGFRDPENRHSHLSVEERTDIALVFLKALEKQGYEAMFYASKNEMEEDLLWEASRIEEKYKVWVAQYPEFPYPETSKSDYSRPHQMWQYSREGEVPGISAPVDLDIAYFGYSQAGEPKNTEPPEPALPDPEAMMTFEEVWEHVTAKDEVNLRDIPSQDRMATVMTTLVNGEIAMRTGISSSGWSRLVYEGVTYYAVSSYLTTDLDGTGEDEPIIDHDGDGIATEFDAADDTVTAKDVVNLRSIPSVTDEEAKVLGQLKKGDTAHRTGISGNGWSRLEWNGTVCYAVTNYLEVVGATEQEEAGIQTEFRDADDYVTAKEAVNLRTLPSVTDPESKVVHQLKKGETVHRTGVNSDVGWSRVVWEGQVLYCVTSYLKVVENP